MTPQIDLEQRLWDFVYDLTSPDEATALRERITSDPDVARLYAEVRLQADVLAEAACVDDDAFQLERPADEAIAGRRDELFPASRRPLSVRVASGSVAIAASLLLCLLGYAYLRPESPIRETAFVATTQKLEEAAVQTTLIGPAKLQAGEANYLTVLTQSPGKPAPPVRVEYELRDETGRVVDRGESPDETTGMFQVMTPRSLRASKLVMEVKTNAGVDLPALTQSLPVEEDAPALVVRTDRPVYAPGETVRYRALALSRSDQYACPQVPVQVALADAARGRRLAESAQQTTDDFGVVVGQFTAPDDLAGGQYLVKAQAADRKAAATDLAVKIQKLDAVVPTAETLAAASDQRDLSRLDEAKAASLSMAKALDTSAVTLDVGRGVFAETAAIEVSLPSRAATPTTAIVARSQGRIVGQEFLAGSKALADDLGLSDCQVTVPLEPQAAGVIRLTAYDYGRRPPQPLAERFVFRRPADYLNIDVYPTDTAFSPGATVRLQIGVQNEAGLAQPCTLGVAVVDESRLPAADAVPSLAAQWWLTSQLPPMAWDRSPDFYLDPQNEEALSRLLREHAPPVNASVSGLMLAQNAPTGARADAFAYGSLGDEAAAAKSAKAVTDPSAPRVLAQNVHQVRTAMAREVNSLRDLREATARHLGSLVAVLSLGLWIGVALLAILRLTAGARVWVPALATATVCLIVGGLWMNAQVDDRGQLAWLPQWTAPRELAKAEPERAAAPTAASSVERLSEVTGAPAAADARAENAPTESPQPEGANPEPLVRDKLEGQTAAALAETAPAPDSERQESRDEGAMSALKRLADRSPPAPAGPADAVPPATATPPQSRPMAMEGRPAAGAELGMDGMGFMGGMGGGAMRRAAQPMPFGGSGAAKDSARRSEVGSGFALPAAPRVSAPSPAAASPLASESGGPGKAPMASANTRAEKAREQKINEKQDDSAEVKKSARDADAHPTAESAAQALLMKEQSNGNRADATRGLSEEERLADKRKELKPKTTAMKDAKATEEGLDDIRLRVGMAAPSGQAEIHRAKREQAEPKPEEPAEPTAKAVPAPAIELGRKLLRPTAGKSTAAAPVVYWEPRLQTNATGQATLAFTLPPTPGTYRVTIDAHAPGRIGSQIILLHAAPPPAAAAEAVKK